jgi:enolase
VTQLDSLRLDCSALVDCLSQLQGRYSSLGDFDRRLRRLADSEGVGSDVTLAVSLAFARATAAAFGTELRHVFAPPAPRGGPAPHVLMNAFSGGIHCGPSPDSFQQIMIIPEGETFLDRLDAGLSLYHELERAVFHDSMPTLSASSGFMVVGVGSESLLELLRNTIDETKIAASIGIDVAGEHLREPDGRYRFEGSSLEPAVFEALLANYVGRFDLTYLEDPFDCADRDHWRSLMANVGGAALIVGDDLFTSMEDLIDPSLASGIVLKMSHAGSVSETIAAGQRARDAGMRLCVSHRSGETDDCAMCDLAAALQAELIKVGGPRRGDRIDKYNHLIRLSKECKW